MTAYELAEFIETGGENIDRKELANTLRQQADRIAELEKESANLEQSLKNALVFIDKNKQTKPLSDEEIIAIRDSCYFQSGIDEWEFDDVNFARAIEERHGIK